MASCSDSLAQPMCIGSVIEWMKQRPAEGQTETGRAAKDLPMEDVIPVSERSHVTPTFPLETWHAIFK